MSEINWVEEKEKCANSPYYFFTNYCLIDGQKPTVIVSEEEFNKRFWMIHNIYKAGQYNVFGNAHNSEKIVPTNIKVECG